MPFTKTASTVSSTPMAGAPSAYWKHFATVRLRTSKTKRAGSRTACLIGIQTCGVRGESPGKLTGGALRAAVIAGAIFEGRRKIAA
jgi:hypothetical protein